MNEIEIIPIGPMADPPWLTEEEFRAWLAELCRVPAEYFKAEYPSAAMSEEQRRHFWAQFWTQYI